MKSDDRVFLRFVNALEISIERPAIKESKLLAKVYGSDSENDNDNKYEWNADSSLIDEDYYNLPKEKGYAKEHYLRGAFLSIGGKDRGFTSKVLEVWGVE